MKRWIEDERLKAIEMIKNGVANRVIAAKFGMASSSVRLLKYNEVLVNHERVTCLICGRRLKQISQKHLLIKHGINLEEYRAKFPDAEIHTPSRLSRYHSFHHPNKGKTYEEIYGKEEAAKKKKVIGEKGLGRPAADRAGTGITGTRSDTGRFARSTYEANIDRIAALEGKRLAGEFDKENKRFDLLYGNNVHVTYCPDRCDLDGLFKQGAYLEVKGYMYPEDWEKIQLCRKQYPEDTILVISTDEAYLDIDYNDLKMKYKSRIGLWEDSYQNLKNRPDLYLPGYVSPEKKKTEEELFPGGISRDISDEHRLFIAKRCISYNKVRLGKRVLVATVELVRISSRRPDASRSSSGKYHYELWKILTSDGKVFFVANHDKTNVFYCYEAEKEKYLLDFYQSEVETLPYGLKTTKEHSAILEDVWKYSDSHKRRVLQLLNDCLKHRGIKTIVTDLSLAETAPSKRGALNQYERWHVYCNGSTIPSYGFSNFGEATFCYRLIGADA
jgi:hypothetical protein